MFPNLNAEEARKGFTDGDAAKILGLSRDTYVSKKKLGTFKLSEIKKLIAYYGCSFDYLFESSVDSKTA